MSRGTYSAGKRQRDAEKARKKRRKAERREQKRRRGPGEIPVAEVEEVTGDLEAIDAAQQARREAAPRGARAIACRLFVGSLSWDTGENELRDAFSRYGEVSEVVVVRERDTGKSRGFGFVVMQNRKDVARTIEALHESELDGRRIVVSVATERKR